MKNITGKLKFAQRYSHSYFVAKNKKNIYACPLCFDEYPVTEANVLTWDHFPPQSVGGTQKVLVCEECRSNWHSIDTELDKVKKIETFQNNFPKHQPKILKAEIAPGLVHRVAFNFSDGAIEIKPRLLGDGATRYFSEIVSDIYPNKTSNGQKFKIENDIDYSCDEDKVRMAIIKAAYLSAFFTFGYPFILSDVFTIICKGMKNPDLEWYPIPVGIKLLEDNRHSCGIFFYYINNLNIIRGLGIKILIRPIGKECFIIFPLPFMEDLPQYDLLSDDIKFESIIIKPDEMFLCNADVKIVDQKGILLPFYRKRS